GTQPNEPPTPRARRSLRRPAAGRRRRLGDAHILAAPGTGQPVTGAVFEGFQGPGAGRTGEADHGTRLKVTATASAIVSAPVGRGKGKMAAKRCLRDQALSGP